MSFCADVSWVRLIKEMAGQSEDARQLQPSLLDLIYAQNWFKLYLPPDWGGVKIDLPAILQLLEAIAQADGSTGWVVTLCSGASWFAGFWNIEQVKLVFLRPDTCITGSGAQSGTAIRTDTGYVVNGFWKHATGALHATHFYSQLLINLSCMS